MLGRDFFKQPTTDVSKNLLGKTLVFFEKKGIITETEAYIGQDDPACHASRGMTKRNEVMFGEAGFSYVYFIYGMYHCLNIVTEKKGFPAAVLIRGIKTKDKNLNGPGKLCKFFGITKDHNAIDLIRNKKFFIEDSNIQYDFKATPRIGISKGKDKLWRYLIK